MCQKLLIIIGDNLFWALDINFSHFSPKKGQKTTFQDSTFGPADNKNAIAILSLWKSIAGIVSAKTKFFFKGGGQNMPLLPFVGLNLSHLLFESLPWHEVPLISFVDITSLAEKACPQLNSDDTKDEEDEETEE